MLPIKVGGIQYKSKFLGRRQFLLQLHHQNFAFMQKILPAELCRLIKNCTSNLSNMQIHSLILTLKRMQEF